MLALSLRGSVHTSKLVRVFLQIRAVMFDSLFGFCRPGHPAFCP